MTSGNSLPNWLHRQRATPWLQLGANSSTKNPPLRPQFAEKCKTTPRDVCNTRTHQSCVCVCEKQQQRKIARISFQLQSLILFFLQSKVTDKWEQTIQVACKLDAILITFPATQFCFGCRNRTFWIHILINVKSICLWYIKVYCSLLISTVILSQQVERSRFVFVQLKTQSAIIILASFLKTSRWSKADIR